MNRPYKKRQIINNVFLRSLYLLLLCLASTGISGQQTYPVQAYTQLVPPYTPHLPAYYTGTQAKLKVMLINTDMQQPLVKVYLRMKILSSSLSLLTPPEVYTSPVELQAGVPLTLLLNDLEPYFRRENLRVSGGQSEFYRTQMLPDNFYRFQFEVYEEGTNRLVSNPKTGFAQAMIASGEPPVPNLPQKGSEIKESSIPSIMFSWTPRHMNSLAAAYGTEYELSLVEIYDKQVAPEAAFDYSRVLYTETTKSTSFIHTAAQPPLIPGLRYAWHVQAKAREGVDEISVFKNGGYSPVFWFDYAIDCKTVQSSGVIYENGRLDISWTDVGAMEYSVEYRKKGTDRWYTGVIPKPLLSCLYNLQSGKDYEYRIGSRCVSGDAFQYNEPQTFHIPEREENGPNCGLMPEINLANQTPARELQSGLPILVGDFPVFVTEVSGSGRFTGEGYVGIPYLSNLQVTVTFKDIVVNTDNRLISGYIETKYDTKNNMMVDIDQILTGGEGVGDIRSGEEKAAFKVDYTINSSIQAIPLKPDGSKDDIKEGETYSLSKGENGKYTFVLTDSEGKEHKVESETIPATVEDKNGNTFEVNETGEINPVSQHTDVSLDNTVKDRQSDIAVLSFKATSNTKYALDEYRDVYEKVIEYKDQYKVEGTAITASAKFMLPGTSDEFAVYIKENKNNKLLPEKVRFITGKNKEYLSKYDRQTRQWIVTVVSGEVNDGQELYAVQDTDDGNYVTLGKLNIYTYESKPLVVRLVSVNGFTNGFTKAAVSQQLNTIYNKVGISCEVEIANSFEYEPLRTQAFNVTGSGLFSTLTDDMKALNNAYMQTSDYKEDVVTLFIIEKVSGNEGVAGDMPRGKQFGYLFSGATAQTVAHEIGHGVFHLDHPFDRANASKSFDKGDLAGNVMEYPPHDGPEFVKLQWDAIHAPGLVIGVFERDKDAMSVIINNENLYACLEEIRQSLKTGSAIKTRSYPTLSDGNITIGGFNYTFVTVQRMKITQSSFSIKDAQPELYSEKNNFGEEQFCIGYRNKTLTIVLKSREEREQMLSYLSDNRTNSYLLFVSGYDWKDEVIDFINNNEARSKSETWWDDVAGFVNKTPVAYDSKEYWGSSLVDNFVTRLRPKKVTYMAGYDNVGTSNHKTLSDFVVSMASSYKAKYTLGVSCYLNPACVSLNTQPNVSGFNQRRNNGKQRGMDYVNMLKSECVKGSDGLVHDTVDVVCHSMGFAHALGIIDDIKEAIKTDLKGLKLGRFYIIAPENACSGEVNVDEWEQVWQYGTDEKNASLWLQDGVAPQCPVEGLFDIKNKSGRACIEDQIKNGTKIPQGFLESHKIENYDWMFNLKSDAKGYIIQRK